MIDISNTDYITKSGLIYRKINESEFYPISKHLVKTCGYYYVGIRLKNGENKTRRFHRLVATTFINNPDPENLTIVGHKNNIKTDCRIENLYWTTTQENTLKAVEDGLLENKKGIDNLLSTPIKVNDLKGNTIAIYGSIGEAERCIKNVKKGYISKMLHKKGNYKPKNKKYIYISISHSEYAEMSEKYRGIELVENISIPQKQKIFKAINIYSGNEIISDNQKMFAKEHGLEQATISSKLRKNDTTPYKGWQIYLVSEIEYSQSSAYTNFYELANKIKATNTVSKEILEFGSETDLKKHFKVNGHDLSHYLKNGCLLFSKWKLELLN